MLLSLISFGYERFCILILLVREEISMIGERYEKHKSSKKNKNKIKIYNQLMRQAGVQVILQHMGSRRGNVNLKIGFSECQSSLLMPKMRICLCLTHDMTKTIRIIWKYIE